MSLEIYVTNTYAIPVIIASVLLAGLLAFFHYRKEKDDVLGKKQKIGLSIIRFVAFMLVGILLSEVSLKHIESKKLKPIIIVAVDDTKSMSPLKTTTDSVLSQFDAYFRTTEVHNWQFGEDVSRADEFIFDKKESNYSQLFDELTQSYLNANIGAVLLLGDGIFNRGIDPVFQSKQFPFPVYTIGIGDTTRFVDAAIKSVSHNETAFLDSYFPVEIGIDFSLAAGSRAKLEIFKNDEPIYLQEIPVTSDHQFVNELISLKAETAGINNFKLIISGIENETNRVNNSYEFSVFVVSEKQKILILGSGVHPDLAAINNALKNNQNYSLSLQTGIKDVFSFDGYDLIVAHQMPDESRDSFNTIQKIMQSRIPVLFILGEQSSTSLFNQAQKSIHLPNTEVFENAGAAVNEQFNLFKLERSIQEAFESFPPLSIPLGNTSLKTGFQTIFFQSIQSIETENPLIAIGADGNQRIGFVLGEGIWRWRIYDYLQNNSHENFDELFQKITNYLIIKPNEDNFNIYCTNIFNENEQVNMHAELYNASNELVNDPEVEIVIVAEDSTNYSYTFDRQDLNYRLNAGKLPVGNYTYSAKTILAEQELIKHGAFRVAASQHEILETKANFQLLNQIAKNTGGQFFHVNEIDELFIELEKSRLVKSKKIKQPVFQDLLDLKWLFVFIVLLFSMEWFLRKFWGTY